MTIRLIWINVCFVLSLMVSASSYSAEPTVILLGYSGPLSGMSAAYGKSLMQAAQLAIDEANQEGVKLGGKPVIFRLLAQDDKHNANLATFVANYLVQAGVVGVIGNTNTTNSMATSKTFDDAKVAHISPATTGRAFTNQGHISAFRLVGNDDNGLRLFAPYLIRGLKAKRIAVLDNQTTFGIGISSTFTNIVNSEGGNIVTKNTVSSKTSDFNAVLKNILEAKADYLFFGGNAEQTAVLARSIKRLNIPVRLVSAMAGTMGNLFLEVARDAADGTIAMEVGEPLQKMPGGVIFENKYRRAYDENINPFTIFAYDAAKVLIQAIKEADSVDRLKIVNSLHRIQYRGATGAISFDAQGDRNFPTFTVYEMTKQKWRTLKILSQN